MKNEPEEDVKIEKVSRRTDLDCLIEDYITEAEERQTVPKMTLYKYDIEKPNGGGEKEFIGYFLSEEIPNKHKIGLMFGGGRYQAFLYQPKGKAEENEQKGITFRIGHVYDDHKKAFDEQKRIEAMSKLPVPAAGQQFFPAPVAPGAGTADAFGMVKEILALFLPIIKAQHTAPAPTAGQDMAQQYAVMQQILKKNLFDTADTYRSFTRRFNISDDPDQAGIDTDEDQQQPPPKEPGLMDHVEKIIKMIEPFFALIAGKGPAAQATAQTVHAIPQFREILGDPQLCRLIIQYFDRTKGREASDRALVNLGINRAALFAAATSPGPGGRPANQSAAAARAPGKPHNGKVRRNPATLPQAA